MARELDIEPNNRIENSEVKEFMQELENTLSNNQRVNLKDGYTTLYDEVLNEIDIALKYKGKLNSIIKECMKKEPYENDFWYIDYDKDKNTYSMDLYSDGECQKFPITIQDIQNYNYKVDMTYWAFEDGRMLEEDAIKDSIKIDVDSALADLERNNKKK